MKALILRILLPLGLLLAAPLAVQAGETITGVINGYGCAAKGETCPADRNDPHLALERDFVIMTSGGGYYLMPNIPRDTKVRHALEQAQVMGDVNKKFGSIDVDVLKVKRDGEYRTVWSKEWAMQERERIYGEGEPPGPGMAQ